MVDAVALIEKFLLKFKFDFPYRRFNDDTSINASLRTCRSVRESDWQTTITCFAPEEFLSIVLSVRLGDLV